MISLSANPYESPASLETCQPSPPYNLFTLPAVLVAAFFLNLPPAIFFMTLNCFRTGRTRTAWLLLLAGAALTLCILFIQIQLEDKAVLYLLGAAANGLVAFLLFQFLQAPILQQHRENGGRTVPIWLAALIALAIEVPYLVICVGIF